jgi:hypothetical protein
VLPPKPTDGPRLLHVFGEDHYGGEISFSLHPLAALDTAKSLLAAAELAIARGCSRECRPGRDEQRGQEAVS